MKPQYTLTSEKEFPSNLVILNANLAKTNAPLCLSQQDDLGIWRVSTNSQTIITETKYGINDSKHL